MTRTTIDYDFGDVVLVPFPFTDLTASKKRPAVVVSSAPYNHKYPDLIIMAVTSQIKPSNVFGEVTIIQWKKAGLLKPSVVKPVLATIEKELVLKKLGRLVEEERRALLETLKKILSE